MYSIESPTIDYNGEICVEFQYHMYGSAMGRLTVTQSFRSTPLFEESGDKSNQWYTANLNANIQRGEQVGTYIISIAAY